MKTSFFHKARYLLLTCATILSHNLYAQQPLALPQPVPTNYLTRLEQGGEWSYWSRAASNNTANTVANYNLMIEPNNYVNDGFVIYTGGANYHAADDWSLEPVMDPIAVEPGSSWKFKVAIAGRALGMLPTNQPEYAGVFLGFITYDENMNVINWGQEFTNSNIKGSFTWKEYFTTFTVPTAQDGQPQITYIKPRLWTMPNSGGGEIYLKDAALTNAADVDSYVNTFLTSNPLVPKSKFNVPFIGVNGSWATDSYLSISNQDLNYILSSTGWSATSTNSSNGTNSTTLQLKFPQEGNYGEPVYKMYFKDLSDVNMEIKPTNPIDISALSPGKKLTYFVTLSANSLGGENKSSKRGLTISFDQYNEQNEFVSNFPGEENAIRRTGNMHWQTLVLTYTVPASGIIKKIIPKIKVVGGGEVIIKSAELLPIDNPSQEYIDNFSAGLNNQYTLNNINTNDWFFLTPTGNYGATLPSPYSSNRKLVSGVTAGTVPVVGGTNPTNINYIGGMDYVASDDWSLSPYNTSALSLELDQNGNAKAQTWTFTAVIAGRSVGDMPTGGNKSSLGVMADFVQFNTSAPDYLDNPTQVISWGDRNGAKFTGTFPWRKVSYTISIPAGSNIKAIKPRLWSIENAGGGEVYLYKASLIPGSTADASLDVPTTPIPHSTLNCPSIYYPQSHQLANTDTQFNNWQVDLNPIDDEIYKSEYIAGIEKEDISYFAIRNYHTTNPNLNNAIQQMPFTTSGNAIPVVEGETWTFSAVIAGRAIGDMNSNCSVEPSTGYGLNLSIVSYDNNGNVINWSAASSPVLKGTFGWTLQSTTFTIPAGVSSIKPRIWASGGGEYYVYDMAVLPIAQGKIPNSFTVPDNDKFPSSPYNVQPELTHKNNPNASTEHSVPTPKWKFEGNHNIEVYKTGVERFVITFNYPWNAPDGNWKLSTDACLIKPSTNYTFMVDAMGDVLSFDGTVSDEIFKIDVEQIDANGNIISSAFTTKISGTSGTPTGDTQKWTGIDGFLGWQRFTVNCSPLNPNTRALKVYIKGNNSTGQIHLANMRLLPISPNQAQDICPKASSLPYITSPSISAGNVWWSTLPTNWRLKADFPIGTYAYSESVPNTDGTNSDYIAVQSYNNTYWELTTPHKYRVIPGKTYKFKALVKTRGVNLLLNNKIGVAFQGYNAYDQQLCSHNHIINSNNWTTWEYNNTTYHKIDENGKFINTIPNNSICNATRFMLLRTNNDVYSTTNPIDYGPDLDYHIIPNPSNGQDNDWTVFECSITIPTKLADGYQQGERNVKLIHPYFYGYGGQLFIQWASLTPENAPNSMSTPNYTPSQLHNMGNPPVGPLIGIGNSGVHAITGLPIKRHATERENTIFLEIATLNKEANTTPTIYTNNKYGLYKNDETIYWKITPIADNDKSWRLPDGMEQALQYKITDGYDNVVTSGTLNGITLSTTKQGQGAIQGIDTPLPTTGCNFNATHGAYNYTLNFTPPSDNPTGFYKLTVWGTIIKNQQVYNLVGYCGAAIDLPNNEQIADPSNNTEVIDSVAFGIGDAPNSVLNRLGLGLQRPLTYNILTNEHGKLPTNFDVYGQSWKTLINSNSWKLYDDKYNNYGGGVELYNEPINEGILPNPTNNSYFNENTNSFNSSAINFTKMVIASRNGIKSGSNAYKVLVGFEHPWIYKAMNEVKTNLPIGTYQSGADGNYSLNPTNSNPYLWDAYDVMAIHPYSMILFLGVPKCPEFKNSHAIQYDSWGIPIINPLWGGEYSLLSDLESYREQASKCQGCSTTSTPKKELWTTEYGWDSPLHFVDQSSISELTQAQYTVRSGLLQIAIANVKKQINYVWKDGEGTTGGGAGNVRLDNKPKALLQAYSIMAKIINKMPYKGYANYGTDSNIGALAFKEGDKVVLALWTPETGSKPITLSSAPNKVYDMFGKSIPPTISISLTQSPQYVVFNSLTDASLNNLFKDKNGNNIPFTILDENGGTEGLGTGYMPINIFNIGE